ncbi:GspF family T2SS innner membrane protein variant XcpS [Pseudomonas sp. UL073]|uniref:General secretion pathway protein F n=1 Tax=Zestomonas insulae TaxID=2809017 RepID=A0ABS2IDQ7_9GAMM|nr:GspF family T2SS innner membrane protein variant XcpS [Pseudomonas insulae]MBM7060885.1 GspF family T2SS innner membrane protein variant XcpS [Pseudomonas insulae]
MAAFEYLALDPAGRQQKGVLEADSARQVRQLLRERQLAPLEVKPTRVREPVSSGVFHFARGLSARDLALLTRQLATLVQAGLPIEEAVRAAAAQASAPRVQSMLLAVRARVLEGHSLAASLKEFPAAFPELYRATVAAGEHAGHLGPVLEQLADYTEQRQQSRQKVQLALLYPLILMVTSLLIVGFLLGYVVPDVVKVFIDSGQTLPLLTRVLIATSDLVKHWGWLLLLLIVAAVLGLRQALRDDGVRLRWHRFLLHVPLVGRLIRATDCARFVSTLAILTRSGVPLVEALSIAAEVIANRVIRAHVVVVAQKVREGGSLTRALEASGQFPPMMLHMIASGERSGELDQMLARTARNQEGDLAAQVALLVGLFEPFMLVFMGAVVLVIVLAILLPILSLNQLVG